MKYLFYIQNMLHWPRKYLLLPFSILYGIVMEIRNFLYAKQYFSVYKTDNNANFTPKIISIGNLSVGGTGKTPHIEYLIRYLQKEHKKIATLSRGYGRKKKGFLEVMEDFSSLKTGDEPLQFRLKFSRNLYPNLRIYVCENRVEGVKKIQEIYPDTAFILLDDAFQHRAIQPNLNIVLSDYRNLINRDFVLPSGNLREFSHNIRRADILIITKCPPNLAAGEKQAIIEQMKWKKEYVDSTEPDFFFTSIQYKNIQPVFPEISTGKFFSNNTTNIQLNILLVTGIAKSEYLKNYLQIQTHYIEELRFRDHHIFTEKDILKMITIFNQMQMPKIILTTEKDAVKLKEFSRLRDYPIYFQDIEIVFDQPENEIHFQQIIHRKVLGRESL